MRIQRRFIPAILLLIAVIPGLRPASAAPTVEWVDTVEYAGSSGTVGDLAPNDACVSGCVGPRGVGFSIEGDEGTVTVSLEDASGLPVRARFAFVDWQDLPLASGTFCSSGAIDVPVDAVWLSIRPGGQAGGDCGAVATKGRITMSYRVFSGRPHVTEFSPNTVAAGVRAPAVISGAFLDQRTSVSVSGAGVGVEVRRATRNEWMGILDAVISAEADAAPGLRDATIVNGAGLTWTCSGCIEIVPAARIDRIEPSTGRIGRSTDVTIVGANLTGAHGIGVVPMGFGTLGVEGLPEMSFPGPSMQEVYVSHVTVVDDRTITATLNIQPHATPGPRTVQVVGKGGDRATCRGCFSITLA